MTETIDAMEGHYMEGMDLNFIPVMLKHLLNPLRMFGPMASTFWTHSSVLTEALTHL